MADSEPLGIVIMALGAVALMYFLGWPYARRMRVRLPSIWLEGGIDQHDLGRIEGRLIEHKRQREYLKWSLSDCRKRGEELRVDVARNMVPPGVETVDSIHNAIQGIGSLFQEGRFYEWVIGTKAILFSHGEEEFARRFSHPSSPPKNSEELLNAFDRQLKVLDGIISEL